MKPNYLAFVSYGRFEHPLAIFNLRTKKTLRVWLNCALLAFVFMPLIKAQTASVGPAQAGTIAGRIVNPVSGDYIGNAEIRVEGIDIVVYSNIDGSYRIYNIPEGEHIVRVSYTGYVSSAATVTVRPRQTTTQNFDLSSSLAREGDGLVRMESVTVSAGREGQAKAIMEQRAAMTTTNVIAADSFGTLAEGNVGELLQYLPGVEVETDASLSYTVNIRGMGPDYGGLTVDGMAGITTHAGGRAPNYVRTNLSAVDLVELNKTVSADMDASAPAGTVNLRTRSAFQRQGRSLTWQMYGAGTSAEMHLKRTYGAGYDRFRKIFPGGSLDYSDVLMKGKLGVVATMAYSTRHLPSNREAITYDKTPTAARPEPVVVSNVTFSDVPVLRKVFNSGLSLDYKAGENLVVSLRGQQQNTRHNFYTKNIALVATRAVQTADSDSTTMTAVASATGGNNPRITASSGKVEREQVNWMIRPSLVYTGRNLEVDLSFAYSEYDHGRKQRHPIAAGMGDGSLATINTTLFPAGWTMSRRGASDTAWDFQQTAGRDLWVPENWHASASANNIIYAVEHTGREQYIGQINAKYRTDWSVPTFFKVGLKSDEQMYRLDSRTYNFTYVGPTGNLAEAEIPVSGNALVHRPDRYGSLFSKPFYVRDLYETERLMSENPSHFVPAATNATSAANTFPHRYVRERIDSAYIMANTQWKRWLFQAGVRRENTRHVYRVYERGVAERRLGKYDGVFFSGAAKYRFRPNLQATFSYSQSVRRPAYTNLTGVATINDTSMTGNIPNPGLKPEWGDNYSARLEYYFEPAGNIAIGVFQSDLTDLIYQRTVVPAEEIGLGDEYPGYFFTTWGNRDSPFRRRGFEIEYRQQLVFLPGALRGLGVFANYARTTNTDPNFQFNVAPATASAGLNYRYRRLTTGLNGSWADAKLFSATQSTKARIMIGLSFGYRITDKISLFAMGRDLLARPTQRFDRNYPDHLTTYMRFSTQWTAGVSGSL